ncbi:MAG: hypothetical protein ACI86M_002931, partial [Saprospiraceae bacterium]
KGSETGFFSISHFSKHPFIDPDTDIGKFTD